MLDDLFDDLNLETPTLEFDYARKEGWEQFVSFDASQPVEMSMGDYEALSSTERALYNLGRERFMTVEFRVSTPSLRNAAKAIHNAMADNRSPDASKSGVIISGRPGYGKTTAVLEFGRALERRRRGPSGQSRKNFIPVAYVPVPTHATAKTMISKILDFYGAIYSQTTRYDTLLERATGIMRKAATQLVIIDDIHRLDLTYRHNEQVADALKEVSERCPGTMVYAGVDVAKNGLFWGSRGEQNMARFEVVHFDRYEVDSPEGFAVWGRVIAELESSLCLLQQPHLELVSIARELHELSGGSIGRLAKAVRRGARDAIGNHTERLDLDQILANLAAGRATAQWVEDEEGERRARRRHRARAR